MTAFRFALGEVRKIRVEEEREEAVKLARARERARAAEQARDDLERVREAGWRHLRRAHGDGQTVGQLQNLARIVSRLESRLAEARERAEEAREVTEQRMEEFREAYRARRTMDRLRDRRRREWEKERSRREQKEADEVAGRRHARSRAETPELRRNHSGGDHP